LLKMSTDTYQKYRKMLRMGVPIKQVETAIRIDGLDPSKFDYVEDNPTGAASSTDGGGSGSLAERLGGLEARGDDYDKYRKMLKCGLPDGAVEQKMTQDGVASIKLGASSSAPQQPPAPKQVTTSPDTSPQATATKPSPPLQVKPNPPPITAVIAAKPATSTSTSTAKPNPPPIAAAKAKSTTAIVNSKLPPPAMVSKDKSTRLPKSEGSFA
jgi:hypothetical protein